MGPCKTQPTVLLPAQQADQREEASDQQGQEADAQELSIGTEPCHVTATEICHAPGDVRNEGAQHRGQGRENSEDGRSPHEAVRIDAKAHQEVHLEMEVPRFEVRRRHGELRALPRAMRCLVSVSVAAILTLFHGSRGSLGRDGWANERSSLGELVGPKQAEQCHQAVNQRGSHRALIPNAVTNPQREEQASRTGQIAVLDASEYVRDDPKILPLLHGFPATPFPKLGQPQHQNDRHANHVGFEGQKSQAQTVGFPLYLLVSFHLFNEPVGCGSFVVPTVFICQRS
jgi:hypothetical protein